MPSKAVRPVGPGALFNTSRHALGICRRVCNTGRYSSSSQALAGQSVEAVIENAVAAVVMQHGILRVGIAGEESKEPFFSYVDTMDLRKMVTWKPLGGDETRYEARLLKSLERIHDALWDDLEDRPGWEVIVHYASNALTASTIVLDITFAFHHAYADGVASKLFHRDLLKALNGPANPPPELKEHVLHFTSPPELLPDIGTVVPLKISWGYLLRTIWSEIIWHEMVPAWMKSKPPPDSIPWTGEKISVEPHHVQIRVLRITQSTLERILEACREHSTTLTPLLHVLIAASLSQRLSSETAPAFSTTTPIDLRRYAKSEYDVANNITGLVSSHDDGFDARTLSVLRYSSGEQDGSTTDAPVWEIASDLSSQLRQKVSILPNDDIVGMTSWVSDWQKFWTDKFGAKRSSTWEVSNIGSLKAVEANANSRNPWYITGSMMTQGALPAGAAFSVNVAGAEGEGVCLSLTWQETIVESELMDGLAADLKAWLRNMGNEGKLGVLRTTG